MAMIPTALDPAVQWSTTREISPTAVYAVKDDLLVRQT
jgi:hypothetical protein